ncbi:hypothetical protein ISCGN_019611 [Ixodes scapularis]
MVTRLAPTKTPLTRRALMERIAARSDKTKQRLLDELGKAEHIGNHGRLLEKFQPVMKPIANALDILQADDKMYLGYLLPTITATRRRLAALSGLEDCRPLKSAITDGIEKRFTGAMDDTALVISALLITRFKLQRVPEADRDRVIQLLKTEVSRLPRREHHATSDPPATGEPEDFFSFNKEGHCRRDSEAQDVMLYLQSDDNDVKDVLKYSTLHSLFLKFNAAVPSRWFSNSTLRRHAYKELFEDLKEQEVEAESAKKDCHMPFMKLSGTRWLVRGRVIKRFLEHWNELKAYFKLAMQEGSQEVRYKARLIHDMLHDDVNYLYFVFLSPVVLEFEKINAFFQSVNIDPDKMFKELDVLHRALKSRIFNRQGHRLSLGMTDFGAQFTSELLRCCKHQESNLSDAAVQGLKQRCQDFLSHLLKEVEKRLPAHQAIFQGISGLHTSKVLSQTARLSVLQLPLHHLIEESLDVIEMQYRKIVMHLWSEETVFSGKLPEDSGTFWAGIFKYQNGMGQKPYKELALYALACLSCPVSNAVVERVFSQVTCVKTKYRNKMSLKTLDAIVRVRSTLASREVCCVKFTITDDMLRRFQSDIYDAQTDD